MNNNKKILFFLTSSLVWGSWASSRSGLAAAGRLACLDCCNNPPALNHETNLFPSVTILWKLILSWWNQVKNMWFCLTNSVRGSVRSWGAFPVTCACIQVCVCMIVHVSIERASSYIEKCIHLFFNCVQHTWLNYIKYQTVVYNSRINIQFSCF